MPSAEHIACPLVLIRLSYPRWHQYVLVSAARLGGQRRCVSLILAAVRLAAASSK
jgi:hypothetical protein